MAHVESLKRELRSQLEKVVKAARQEAEEGAQAILEQYAVSHPQPFKHLSVEERDLRRRLRARARQLGDVLLSDGRQQIDHLVHECAYEHWHEMLFARFLAENNLLMHPEGVPVSLEECEELATEEGAEDGWEVASRYAARMLPQIFRPDAPVLQLNLSPECRHRLEELLESLPAEVFTASDSLGWVYQFWQAQKKDEVNQSEVKIGADELPAVTQLFTESYMVDFLLHNSLGAWWVSRHPGEDLPVEVSYLRRLDDGSPAAGTFPGWPDTTRELKVLDPCCGSGHFLVAAFHLMVPLRMAEEGLSANEACELVLADNLHGLEIDERCTQIAAFALALATWNYPGTGGYRPLPELHIACSGLAVGAKEEEWVEFAGANKKLQEGMKRLHALFQDAPTLGSLIDPVGQGGDLFSASFDELQPLLQQALAREKQDYAGNELGIAAQGIARAAELLAGKYHLIATNVPYLKRGKQAPKLREFCEHHYPAAKNDLSTVLLERCLKLCAVGGSTALVLPQNWLFLTSYRKLREQLLQEQTWDFLARLGPGAFETISGEIVNVVLLELTRSLPASEHLLHGLDASAPRTAAEKAVSLMEKNVLAVKQRDQLGNPDGIISIDQIQRGSQLSEYGKSIEGLSTGDREQFIFCFWEVDITDPQWEPFQVSPNAIQLYEGFQSLLRWEHGTGALSFSKQARVQGHAAWGKRGVLVGQMKVLKSSLTCGFKHDKMTAVITPVDESHLPAIWVYCSSPEYNVEVRKLTQKLNAATATLVKVPFDLAHWQKVAAKKYPNGLPQPYSDDPTQWLFHGHPVLSTAPLQTAVARLLGYRWPAEQDPDMELAEDARQWITRCRELDDLSDEDGIVCIPPVRGEQTAHNRLQALLAQAYGNQWNTTLRESLLKDVGYNGKNLDDWLRDGFFEQHCQTFHQRPFIWHIWDGRRDGFAALVNYHKLDRRRLETLTYTYLGDWIRRQEDGLKQNIGAAEARLLAAQQLQKKLQLILKGEDPYDIFVRWKSLEEQPIGWEPDLNDGVRLNIRPFVTADVLRKKPKIKWNKDRGKNPADAPWGVDRINDRHLSLAEKQAARSKSSA